MNIRLCDDGASTAFFFWPCTALRASNEARGFSGWQLDVSTFFRDLATELSLPVADSGCSYSGLLEAELCVPRLVWCAVWEASIEELFHGKPCGESRHVQRPDVALFD